MTRFTVVLLILTAMFSTIIVAAPTEFTAQIYLKKSGKMIDDLTAKDFQLFENLREQTITKVAHETLPLSIVLIPMLGEGKYCDTSFFIIPKPPPSNDMSLVANAFYKNLAADDEFAMILPDKEATVLRGFDMPNTDVMKDFAEFRKLSDKSQTTISESYTTTDSMGMGNNTETSSYSGVGVNFAENALDKSLDYLQTQSKDGNRQVIFFLRPFYNLSETTTEKETQIKQTIARQGTLLSWIGDDGEVFPVKPFKFFRNLPILSGSEIQPCKLLKSNDEDKIRTVVSGMLSHLRTRYRITYTSNNDRAPGNLRQPELRLTKSGKKKVKGQAVISVPQLVYVDREVIANRIN